MKHGLRPNRRQPNTAGTASIYVKLRQLQGILKDVYREIGGAERAIREEREGYSRRAWPVDRRKRLPQQN